MNVGWKFTAGGNLAITGKWQRVVVDQDGNRGAKTATWGNIVGTLQTQGGAACADKKGSGGGASEFNVSGTLQLVAAPDHDGDGFRKDEALRPDQAPVLCKDTLRLTCLYDTKPTEKPEVT